MVDKTEPRLIDLMFSCRVQSKRVEHAFLAYILQKYITSTRKDFVANYKKTEKNKPSGQVFYDLGFEDMSENDEITSLIFKKGNKILEDSIIEILTINNIQV